MLKNYPLIGNNDLAKTVKKLWIKPLTFGFSRFYMPADGNHKVFKFGVSGAVPVYKELVRKQKFFKVSAMYSVNRCDFGNGFRGNIYTNDLRWFFLPDFDNRGGVAIADEIISFKSFKFFSVGYIFNISSGNVLYAHALRTTIRFIFSNLKKFYGNIS